MLEAPLSSQSELKSQFIETLQIAGLSKRTTPALRVAVWSAGFIGLIATPLIWHFGLPPHHSCAAAALVLVAWSVAVYVSPAWLAMWPYVTLLAHGILVSSITGTQVPLDDYGVAIALGAMTFTACLFYVGNRLSAPMLFVIALCTCGPAFGSVLSFVPSSALGFLVTPASAHLALQLTICLLRPLLARNVFLGWATPLGIRRLSLTPAAMWQQELRVPRPPALSQSYPPLAQVHLVWWQRIRDTTDGSDDRSDCQAPGSHHTGSSGGGSSGGGYSGGGSDW